MKQFSLDLLFGPSKLKTEVLVFRRRCVNTLPNTLEGLFLGQLPTTDPSARALAGSPTRAPSSSGRPN